MSWTALAALSAGAYAFKLVGVVAGDRFADRLADNNATTQPEGEVAMAMGDGPSLVVDARLIGVAAGVLAVARRAPMVVVVMVAMGVTALVRLVA